MDAVRIDSSARLMAERDALLMRSGILREEQADAVFGIVNGEGKLVACGNCRGCSLRCIAVDESCRGEDMLSTLVSAMLEYQFMRGISHVFICTKAKNAPIFAGIGFYEVARAGDAAVLMENRRGGFGGYIAALERGSGVQGAIVMNANPFTLGHRYLAQRAAESCDSVHIFVVREDASEFSFEDRLRMVREGVKDIRGAIVHSTGLYMVSRAVFPSYFLKRTEDATAVQAALDANVFIKIAAALSISCRFIGSEPFSAVTNEYNRVLTDTLPKHGIECRETERLTINGCAVSASNVRSLLASGDKERAFALLPPSTQRIIEQIL